ncbi:hypothetical protein A7456_03725 [Moraxella nonliquefaciens]|uniref:Uncharacterized protein n=1 Tax=Moraxella nonliquefaciens TaxID=478 RepID=A0A1B8QI93_MORNO|nr:hypothetical protein A7456_03725 [Moraxella nonliquefaciens]
MTAYNSQMPSTQLPKPKNLPKITTFILGFVLMDHLFSIKLADLRWSIIKTVYHIVIWWLSAMYDAFLLTANTTLINERFTPFFLVVNRCLLISLAKS